MLDLKHEYSSVENEMQNLLSILNSIIICSRGGQAIASLI